MPLYEFSVLFAYAKVMELIDPQQGWWNLDMLYSIFNDVDVQAISQIPISLHGYEDRLIWKGTYHMQKIVKNFVYW